MLALAVVPAFCWWFVGELRLGHRLTWPRLRDGFRLLLRQQKLLEGTTTPEFPALATTALVRMRSESDIGSSPFTLVTVDYRHEAVDVATGVDFTFCCRLPHNLGEAGRTTSQIYVGYLPLPRVVSSKPVAITLERARLALGHRCLRPAKLLELLFCLQSLRGNLGGAVAWPNGHFWILDPVPLGDARSAVWTEKVRYPCIFHKAPTGSNPRHLSLFLFPRPAVLEEGDYLLVVDDLVVHY